MQALLVLSGMAVVLGGQYGKDKLERPIGRHFPLSIPRTTIHNHPVENLVHNARADFSAIIQRQSKSLPEAIQVYKRRYHRPPPLGFEKWYQMAQEANTTLIDEFDSLMQDLEPFWGMSAQELHSRTAMVSTSDAGIKRLMVRDHRMEIESKGYAAYGDEVPEIMNWTHPFAEFLPDMDLVFNNFDEPRVIVPHGVLESSLRYCPIRTKSDTVLGPKLPTVPFEFLNNGRQSIWDLATISCSPDSPASNTHFSPPLRTLHDLDFVRNVSLVKDTCQNPSASMHHGFVVAPDTLRITHQLVPIWSQSKLSSFQDLIMPSPGYTTRHTDKEHEDTTAWSSKIDQLYWVGSTSGGNSNNGNWRYMHRERLVELVNSADEKIILLNQTTQNGPWQPYNTTLSVVRNLFNVAFTAAIQCGGFCESIKKEYPFRDRGKQTDAFKYRFVLDMDGNAWSGRYYSLLRSNSAVVKQGLFQEFHGDNWIKPWVHYIPISMHGGELSEVMRFLTQTVHGQEIAERIAGEGREWAGRALRNVDLQLAAGRAMLEWGRLMDMNRDKEEVCGWGRRVKGRMGGI